jgi:hypothetical protein
MSHYEDNDYDAGVRREWFEAKEPLRALSRTLLHIFNEARSFVASIIDPPKFTYFVSLPSPKEGYISGEQGIASATVNTPYEVVDVVVVCKAGTFVLTSFFIGDQNQFLGSGSVPADLFGPAVQDRGFRSKRAERGHVIQVAFLNQSTSEQPEKIFICLKVRSYRRY